RRQPYRARAQLHRRCGGHRRIPRPPTGSDRRRTRPPRDRARRSSPRGGSHAPDHAEARRPLVGLRPPRVRAGYPAGSPPGRTRGPAPPAAPAPPTARPPTPGTTNPTQKENRTMPRPTTRALAGALTAGAAAIALAGCNLIPIPGGAPAEPGKAVGFEQVQQAVIQLEARGTFVDPQYGGYEGAGRGSGFIISEDGLAVTNNHVVVGAGTIDVWRGGDQSDTLDARVLGASECLDIAVVQLEKDEYPYLAWHKGDIATGIDVY